MSYQAKLLNKLNKSPLSILQFNNILRNADTFFESVDLEKELLLSNGFPIYISNDTVYLKTKQTSILDQVYCIVDIETTAGNPNDGQMIEIGAIKFKNNTIIESYQSLVTAKNVPKNIQKITGITNEMLVGAPNLKSVLEEFKIFLEDDVFVAHNISFDYKFISDSLRKYDLGELHNRKLCTIDLSRRTITAKRYGLDYLKEFLGIDSIPQHRAYNDVLSTVEVFKECFKNLPTEVQNVEELIEFSKNSELKVYNDK